MIFNLTSILLCLLCVPVLGALYLFIFSVLLYHGACLYALSKDPAVYACALAILFSCLAIFAWMNTNTKPDSSWLDRLQWVISVIFSDIGLFWAGFLLLVIFPNIDHRHFILLAILPHYSQELSGEPKCGLKCEHAGLLSQAMTIKCIFAALFALFLFVFVSFDPQFSLELQPLLF